MKFAHPTWLILLILLPLMGLGALVAARLRSGRWSALFAPRLSGILLKRHSPLPHWIALFLLLTACGATVIALARPQGDVPARTDKTLGRNVLIALDLSRSMRVRDVKPDRLSQAKIVISELLDALPNERIGLIGFAGTADIYAPLTVDHPAVRETVAQIDETWPPVGGSNLAAAVHLAIETLHKTGQPHNALVILSDGEQLTGELDAEIIEAARSGIYIIAIGVGTEDGDYVPSPEPGDHRMMGHNRRPILSRLQPAVLRKLATETKGSYATAGSGVNIPAMVQSAIQGIDAFEMEGRARNIPIEFYQWLVLPALVFLLGAVLAETRWRGVQAATLTMAVFLLPGGARADAVAAAKSSLQAGHFPEARVAYHELATEAIVPDRRARFFLGEGTAAYGGQDYAAARAAFSSALLGPNREVRTESLIGLGNTLFQIGWQSLAGDSYPSDARQAPDIPRFDSLIKDRLANLKAATPDQPEATGYTAINDLITNWTDAVRHYDSALAADPSIPQAATNRQTTLRYLNRLRELLDDDRQQTEQAIPPPQPEATQPEPEPGESQNQPQDPKGDSPGPKPPGNKGHANEPPNDKQDKPADKPKPNDKNDGKDKEQPKETPEERARRILKENADLEQGPLTPGRREFLPAEKDW